MNTARTARRQKGAEKVELGQVRILPISSIRPSPENERLYRPVDPKDPEIVALADSITRHGLQEPIVVTVDMYVVSGHRRRVACKLAGRKQVQCRVLPIRRSDDLDAFIVLLREYNRQRVKTFAEKIREEVVSADPQEAYQSLIEHRQQQMYADMPDTIAMRGSKRRAEISPAKEPMLNAIKRVLAERRKFGQLSDRMIHYALLNAPPLIHASKADSFYENTPQCYKALTEILTRARLAGIIPMNAIADETRPVQVWDVHQDVQSFLRREIGGFGKGYWRDLMQSQPDQVEIINEKNTTAGIVKPIAARYCIPLTTGRGYCSLPPRHAIAERFRKSGKARLVLLIVSDFDPDGEEIAHSFARSMRDDFEIDEVVPIKVALTADQVRDFRLPPQMKAKTGSTSYKRFSAEHGDDVFELEALPPADLQRVLQAAIDSVIDVDLFNQEVDQEASDAAELETVRRQVHGMLAEYSESGEEGSGRA